MNNEKVLSMLGIARRAGALSMGHDMALQSLYKHKAQCVLFCKDVSERLVREFEVSAEKAKGEAKFIKTPFTMNEIHMALGYKAGVFTIDDKNFAKRICELMNQEENEW